jgi:four helix bundle protein
MKDFRNLQVWEKSHKLTLLIYKTVSLFPSDEKYGLISQIKRASASIPTNIAEGCGRESDKDFARFLQIAMGSASEVEYLVILSKDLNYLDTETSNLLIESTQEIKKMLASLLKTLRK